MNYQSIIDFWFNEIDPSLWWKKDLNFDNALRDKFSSTLDKAKKGELFSWRESALGCLAEVIVLDQFSRNIYRDQPESFAQDPMALALAQGAVARGLDNELEINQKSFLYMPYMHSESEIIHEEAVKLFSQPGLEGNLDFEHKHRDIILKFGRYPHRNAVLGRESTPAEIEFLKQPNSSF